MQNSGDRGASKLFLLFFIIVLFYLAFFNFDIQKAYDYTFSSDAGLLHAIGF